jgi:hypothetical protein
MNAINKTYLSSVHGTLAVAVHACVLIGALVTNAAYANDFGVYSPYVSRGRSEIEFRGYGFQDGNASLDGTREYDFSVAYGVTDWWKPEVYFAKYGREAGGGTNFIGNEFENIFQLAPMGEYWADPGFLFSYEHMKASGQPDTLEFGPLFGKQINRVNQRLNLIWEKEIGGGASGKYEFRSAYNIHYQLTRAFQPGIEAYYRPNDSASQLGPVISGEFYSTAGRELEYSIGVIFGVNSKAPDQTMVANLEYEF